MKVFCTIVLLLLVLGQRRCSGCSYQGVLGMWTFHESSKTFGPYHNCKDAPPTASIRKINLMYPNTAVDNYGNQGTWTMNSRFGFEVTLAGRSYYSRFNECDNLRTGWARDVTVRAWSCFYAVKDGASVKESVPEEEEIKISDIPLSKFINDHEYIKRINTMQSSWTATAYPEYEQYTLRNMFNREGGIFSVSELPPTVPATAEQKARISNYPLNFDWRNINGVNYVSPVRSQLSCASCYAFASAAMLESRLQIITNNERRDIFSPQDVIDCNPITNGCNGGWPFLTAGRYAQDIGLIDEFCNPYRGEKQVCNRDKRCPRTYVDEYQFIGGYYGGGNEELIMEELVNYGPVAASFYTYSDFNYYKDGIYHHEESAKGNDFEPYQKTNHAVLIVGYGVESTTGEKFWSVKNSWGQHWGEQGYFRIRRGTNEANIESTTVVANPVL